jgi:hypothetical protein
MDEAELTQSLQADLNFFKVKVQVKHREDQLHILVSRSQKNDVDYTVVFDTVQNSLAQKNLTVEAFTVYGRIFGAKQPEWQCNGELPKLTDTADLDQELEQELDFAELTDVLAEDGTIDLPEFESPVMSAPTEIQVPEFTIDEQSLAANIEMPEDLVEVPDFGNELSDISLDADLEIPEISSDDLSDSIRADMSDFEIPDDFAMPEYSASNIDDDADFALPISSSSNDDVDDFALPVSSASSEFADTPEYSAPDDFGMSAEYGNPELSTSEGLGSSTTENAENASPTQGNGKKYLGAIALLGAVAVAGGGWFMFDRSAQEQKLAEAQAAASKAKFDPQQLGKLDALQDTQTQLKKAVTLLEEIPNRPGSYYEQAQTQLQALKPKLQAVEAKLNVEKPAIDKLENAKKLAKEAGIIVQNPPHKSDVWQTAQSKWQESLKLLESIPPNSLASAEAQQKLELYRSNYTTITAQLQKQKQLDFAATLWPNGVTPDLQTALKQLKTSGLAQPKFIDQCVATIRPRLNGDELQQKGFQADTFSKVFCEYVATAN